MVGSNGRDPMQCALYSGRIGGGHPACVPRNLGVANSARRNRGISGVYVVRVREAGEGANSVFVALEKTWNNGDSMEKTNRVVRLAIWGEC